MDINSGSESPMEEWTKEQLITVAKRLSSVFEQNKILKEALEKYADRENWFFEDRSQEYAVINNDDLQDRENDPAYSRGGKWAREALAKIKELENV